MGVNPTASPLPSPWGHHRCGQYALIFLPPASPLQFGSILQSWDEHLQVSVTSALLWEEGEMCLLNTLISTSSLPVSNGGSVIRGLFVWFPCIYIYMSTFSPTHTKFQLILISVVNLELFSFSFGLIDPENTHKRQQLSFYRSERSNRFLSTIQFLPWSPFSTEGKYVEWGKWEVCFKVSTPSTCV